MECKYMNKNNQKRDKTTGTGFYCVIEYNNGLKRLKTENAQGSISPVAPDLS